jgi:hypothetical protein
MSTRYLFGSCPIPMVDTLPLPQPYAERPCPATPTIRQAGFCVLNALVKTFGSTLELMAPQSRFIQQMPAVSISETTQMIGKV